MEQISEFAEPNSEKTQEPAVKLRIEVPCRYLSQQYFLTARPQYPRSCGMSSLVSIFNYQFSTLGMGSLVPLTVEEAYRKLNVIGTGSKAEQFKKGDDDKPAEANNRTLHDYLSSLDFGHFTYNDTLLTWYKLLCRMHSVKGRASYFYKKSGGYRTSITEEQAKSGLVEKLSQGKTCFIYHAHDHYFCPVGYEIVSQSSSQPTSCYYDEIKQKSDLWVMISETAQRFAPLRVVKWSEIQLDLSTRYPNKYDIRNEQKGVYTLKGKEDEEPGGTFHCLLAFEKLE